MSRQAFVVLVLIVAGLFLAEASMYRVGEHEQVLRTEFGKIVGKAVSTPGLHWKAPFVQDVRRLEKRWLQWDGEPNQIPTRDKKYIWVDTFARWRIKDPIKFYERLRDEQSARSRLDDIIDGEVRNVIANHDLIDIVRVSGREFDRGEEVDDGQTDWTMFRPSVGRLKIEASVLAKASMVMPDYGVELADVRIKRINYVDSVQQKVFERMVSERKRIAERYRSEGQGKRAEIEGKVERELLRIRSEAYEKAEEIRGKADAEAAGIYAEAYSRDADLYTFMKTLETYKSVMAENTDLVLSTKSPLLKYLRSQD